VHSLFAMGIFTLVYDLFCPSNITIKPAIIGDVMNESNRYPIYDLLRFFAALATKKLKPIQTIAPIIYIQFLLLKIEVKLHRHGYIAINPIKLVLHI